MLRVLVILLILGAAGWWYWTTTPEFSIRRVKQAVKDHDLTTFNKYVEMDSVASGMVDDLFTIPMQNVLGTGVGMLGRWFVAGAVGLLKPPLVVGIKEDLSRFVTTGRFISEEEGAASGDEASSSQFSLGLMDSRFGFRKHAFRKIEYEHKDGKFCTMGLLFHNEVYNKDLVLEVKMHDEGGYWRLIQLTNFPQFMAKLVQFQVAGVEPSQQRTQQPGLLSQ